MRFTNPYILRRISSLRNVSLGATLVLIAASAGVLIALTDLARGATIDVGTHFLLANTPGQDISIPVTGVDIVAGIDLFAQVGDGGPELVNAALPAGTDGPEISSVNMTSGTIFDVSSAVQTDLDRSGVVQMFFSTVALNPPPGPSTVSASGLVAQITLDTTGFTTGNFDLLLSSVLPGLSGGPFETTLLGTGGAAVSTTVNNGSLIVLSTSDADFNVDTKVDGADFLIWQRGFGVGTTFAQGDADGNGNVDAYDLPIWNFLNGSNTGSLATAFTAIPEPVSCSILFVALVPWLGGFQRIRSNLGMTQ
ncbi:MAG: hypothetical protein CMJ72_04060 [Planctomycetaceae bacterium]|nr:hypothetical protein [Planctomycetaceae bacterium]